MAPFFSLSQCADSTDMSVSVPVPPPTAKPDVSVSARTDRLTVSVAGHARQPHVLDGVLSYDVDPGSLSWMLEGSGASRSLVITLEKAEPVDWSEGLFRAQAAETASPTPDVPCELPSLAAPMAVAAATTVAQPASAASAAAQPLAVAEPPAAAQPAAARGAEPRRAAAASSASGQAPVAAEPPRAAKPLSYEKWDALVLSDDEGEEPARRTGALGGESDAEIWSDLMSGKKKLLTKDGIVGGSRRY